MLAAEYNLKVSECDSHYFLSSTSWSQNYFETDLDSNKKYTKPFLLTSATNAWGGGGNPWEFDCAVYPQGGSFDH